MNSNKDFDTRAIKIDYIAKNSEETDFLEEELDFSIDDISDNQEEGESTSHSKNDEEVSLELQALLDEDYVDAFENVVYFDDLGLNDEDLEDLTEEIYPGVRKLKPKTEDEEE